MSTKKRKFEGGFFNYVSGKTATDAKNLLNSIDSLQNARKTLSAKVSEQEHDILTLKSAVATYHKNEIVLKNDIRHLSTQDDKQRAELAKCRETIQKHIKCRNNAFDQTKEATVDITNAIETYIREGGEVKRLNALHQTIMASMTNMMIQMIKLERIQKLSVTSDQHRQSLLQDVARITAENNLLKKENNKFKAVYRAQAEAVALAHNNAHFLENVD